MLTSKCGGVLNVNTIYKKKQNLICATPQGKWK